MEESIATLTRHHEKTKKCLAPKSDSSDLEQQKASSFDFGMEENLSRTLARSRASKSYTKARSSSEGCLTFKKQQQNFITSKYILKDDPSLIKFSQKDFELPTDLSELNFTDITTTELQKDITKMSVSEEEEGENSESSNEEERPRVPPPSPRRFLSCVDIEPSANADRSSETSETSEQCSTGCDEQTSEVRYARNTSKMTTLMHVDPTLPLWMFFDVYGNVQKIKILGSAHPSQIRRLRPASACLGNSSGLTVALPPRQCTTPTTPTQYHVSHSGPTSNNNNNNNNNNNSSSSSSSSSTSSTSSSSSSSAAMSTLVLRSLSVPTSSFHHTSLGSGSSLLNGAGGSHLQLQQQQHQQPPTKVYSVPPMPPPHYNRASQHSPHILYPSTSFESGLSPSIMTASSDNNPIADNESNECNVCYERSINCVLYTCGHMCMCFECAMAVKKDRGALCPICRQHIKDVIKIFRS